MTGEVEYISVRTAFLHIEEKINETLPVKPIESNEDFLAPLADSNRAEKREDPASVTVDDEAVPRGFVWQESVDLAWAIFDRASSIFVARADQEIKTVSTPAFGCDFF